ncbi:MAG: bile acid:sodium symporter family protein [Negativicutes bacterium]|nr:bile acid:sodium symporter family protein [Negativicutes bacterium]
MLNRLYGWISRNLFYGVLLSLAAGYFFPLEATPLLRRSVMVLFGYMTLVTALGTSFREFLKVSRSPKVPLYILSIVHIGTPVVAWIVGRLVFPDNHNIQIGYLIFAAIPVGVTSIIWTAIVKGNVPVSLVTVTIDTIVAPLLLPVYILVVVGVAVSIDYTAMAAELLVMITLPSIIGMLLHDRTGGRTMAFVQGLGGVASRMSFFGVIYLSAAVVAPTIVWNAAIVKVLLVTMFVVVCSYLLGFAASRVIHADHGITLAMIYNTGMRNIATGLVIAAGYFPPEVAIPITLGMLFQQPLAALTARLYSKMHPGYYAETKTAV